VCVGSGVFFAPVCVCVCVCVCAANEAKEEGSDQQNEHDNGEGAGSTLTRAPSADDTVTTRTACEMDRFHTVQATNMVSGGVATGGWPFHTVQARNMVSGGVWLLVDGPSTLSRPQTWLAVWCTASAQRR
jgi:hypothetical protein